MRLTCNISHGCGLNGTPSLNKCSATEFVTTLELPQPYCTVTENAIVIHSARVYGTPLPPPPGSQDLKTQRWHVPTYSPTHTITVGSDLVQSQCLGGGWVSWDVINCNTATIKKWFLSQRGPSSRSAGVLGQLIPWPPSRRHWIHNILYNIIKQQNM